MFFNKRVIKYQQLASDSDDGAQSQLGDVGPASRISPYLSTGALLLCLLCTVVNVVLFQLAPPATGRYSFPSSTTFLTSRGVSRKDLDNLRRPSQFVGFENLRRVGPPAAKSFVNFPLLLAQVDSSMPKQKSAPYTGVRTDIGTIYPELGRVVASKSVSTVVQFRALDYGMELCELRIALSANASVSAGNRPLVLPLSHVEIFSLDYGKPLHADSISYSSRPPRGDKIADIVLDYGSVWTHRFECQMDHLYTFEVACPLQSQDPKPCELAWEQDKEHDSVPAFTMVQYSTI
ncbi:hypothetical protein R3P38DRAFT_2730461 [Favolaschia claudopus]|uniref:Ubiquitin 3 binding protein But2 C-terminal domain-containing protein n=1 Tax=Favolaschia claudopus TaxID=2862362 RepID=A0AAW0A6U1_9AGAR